MIKGEAQLLSVDLKIWDHIKTCFVPALGTIDKINVH